MIGQAAMYLLASKDLIEILRDHNELSVAQIQNILYQKGYKISEEWIRRKLRAMEREGLVKKRKVWFVFRYSLTSDKQ